MDTDRTKGTTVSKKRNFFLAGLATVAGFVAALGAKNAANKRKQAAAEAQSSDPLPREEAHSGVAAAKKANQKPAVDKTTDEDQPDSAEDAAADDSHVNRSNTPRPGAL